MDFKAYDVPVILRTVAPSALQPKSHGKIAMYWSMNFGGICDAAKVLRGIDIFKRELNRAKKDDNSVEYDPDNINVISLEDRIVLRVCLTRAYRPGLNKS